jgi:SM-20-related protein
MAPTAPESALDLAYDALDATPISTDPFPHVTVRNFVPVATLQQVTAGLPQLRNGGSHPIPSLRLGAEAQALMQALEGPRFRQAIAAKFDLDLADAPTMVTLRGYSREKDGRIHCDSTAKRVTVLLYLSPESESWSRQEGCLRLLRGPSDLDDYAEEVPPTNGTLLVFPNGPTTWHGHKTFVGPRYVVQLNYMTNDDKARHELRRHRLSSFLKRLTPAA